MATEEGTQGQPYHLTDPNLSRSTDPSPGSDDPKQLSVQTHNLPRDGRRRYEDGHDYKPPSPIRATTRKRRITYRKLRPIHVFMLTVNATLGIGLYWRGGQILALGGPLAVILSFLLLGLLVWAITQCITEMLCIWPVPGAMSVFVREFVDPELGIAVGVAYWFTYSVAFASLIAASASEVHYYNPAGNNVGVDAGVLYLLVPLALILVNSFGIEMYGWFEVATGIIKLAFLAVIMIALIVFAVIGPKDASEPRGWDHPIYLDKTAAQDWPTALLMCLSTATFAYIGVEVPAAAALEAQPTRPKRSSPSGQAQNQEGQAPNQDDHDNEASSIGETIRFSSKWVSVFACATYTLSGILVSLSVDPRDCNLPRLDWLDYGACMGGRPVASAFTLVAEARGNEAIARAFNFFQIFTALSCANDGDPDEPWYLNVLAWLGRTNSYRVPIRAMAVSALAFIWVPFLQLYQPTTDTGVTTPEAGAEAVQSSPTNAGINTFISVLAEMGSVAVLIAWACECWAFIRYYHSINKHRGEIEERRIPRVRRFSDQDNDYPYISNGQPLTAYFGLAGCLLVLLVLNGASLWKKFYPEPFLSSYLIVIIFMALWAILKLWRGAKWSLVDLSDPERVIDIIRGLHEFSFAGFQYESRPEPNRGSSLWPLSVLVKRGQ